MFTRLWPRRAIADVNVYAGELKRGVADGVWSCGCWLWCNPHWCITSSLRLSWKKIMHARTQQGMCTMPERQCTAVHWHVFNDLCIYICFWCERERQTDRQAHTHIITHTYMLKRVFRSEWVIHLVIQSVSKSVSNYTTLNESRVQTIKIKFIPYSTQFTGVTGYLLSVLAK